MTRPKGHWANNPEMRAKMAALAKARMEAHPEWFELGRGKNRDYSEIIPKLVAASKKWRQENPEAHQAAAYKATRHFVKDGNPNWKGGISKGYREGNRLTKRSWRELRQVIIGRDEGCTNCGVADKALVVHHIIHWDISHDDSETNLTTLCRSCHMKIHPPLRRLA